MLACCSAGGVYTTGATMCRRLCNGSAINFCRISHNDPCTSSSTSAWLCASVVCAIFVLRTKSISFRMSSTTFASACIADLKCSLSHGKNKV